MPQLLPELSHTKAGQPILMPSSFRRREHDQRSFLLDLWNRLSEDITRINNTITFKRQLLKTENLQCSVFFFSIFVQVKGLLGTHCVSTASYMQEVV